MDPGDTVMFRKSWLSDKLTEGNLLVRVTETDLKGDRPFWHIEYGKKVKKTMVIHEKQIEGLKE